MKIVQTINFVLLLVVIAYVSSETHNEKPYNTTNIYFAKRSDEHAASNHGKSDAEYDYEKAWNEYYAAHPEARPPVGRTKKEDIVASDPIYYPQVHESGFIPGYGGGPFDYNTLLGPEGTGLNTLVAWTSLALGIINIIFLISSLNSIDSLNSDQNSICSVTKALGNTAITYTDQTMDTASTATLAGQIETFEAAFISLQTAVNNYATPTC